MLLSLSRKIVDLLLSKDTCISETEYELSCYGMELALYSLLSTTGLLFCGIVWGMPIRTLIIICIYYVNQTIGGGKHAHSHAACFLLMFFFVNLALYICTIGIPSYLFCAVSLLSFVVMYSFPLVLHRNKQYLVSLATKHIRKSRITLAFFGVGYGIMYMWIPNYIDAYSLGLLFSAVSRLAGKRQKGNEVLPQRRHQMEK